LNKGCFKKGNKPWNKGLKGIRLSPKTEFKKGQFVGETHPSWKGGVQKPINDCVYIWKDVDKRVRRPIEVYQKHYGKIPKGHIIWHIDGDKHNDNISNLECISRAECMKRNFERRWNK
jgi:hypothetical protein